MPNNIALIQNYLKDAEALAQVYKLASITMDLETPEVQFTGANTIKLPVVSFGGSATMGTVNRATGFVAKDVNLTWSAQTLTQYVGDALKLNRLDANESGLTAVKLVNEYIRQIEVPTIDKYRLQKLVEGGTRVKLGAMPTKSTILGKLIDAFTYMAKKGVQGQFILYVTPEIDAMFQQAPELQHQIVQGVWNNQFETKVNLFKGAKFVVMPDDRKPTLSTAGKSFLFALVERSAQWSVKASENAEFYQMVPGFDGSEIDISVYHDTAIHTNRVDGVYIATDEVEA
jgi:hypothetical protein